MSQCEGIGAVRSNLCATFHVRYAEAPELSPTYHERNR